eukprot:COSAG05_NODE_1872_length_3917_cov_8.508381_2_plen_106_part_00
MIAGAGEGGELTAPDRGLQVSPFMMFMLFMGFVYVALTLQQRATRQVTRAVLPSPHLRSPAKYQPVAQDRQDPDSKGGGDGGGDGGGGGGASGGAPEAPEAPAVD